MCKQYRIAENGFPQNAFLPGLRGQLRHCDGGADGAGPAHHRQTGKTGNKTVPAKQPFDTLFLKKKIFISGPPVAVQQAPEGSLPQDGATRLQEQE